MAKKNGTKKNEAKYMTGVSGTLVSLAEAGVRYPGSKTIKTGFRNYLKGLKTGAKHR